MRLLTWNINGVRTIPQYHPWNTLKTHDDILTHLGADIIVPRDEVSRPALPKAVAIPPSFHAFFSFPLKKSGYSGVATYTRHAVVIPLKAEEGITGTLPPPKQSTSEERVSQQEAYPQRVLLDADTDAPLDYRDIDGEGRALVVDFKLFVLINVYCPNDGTGTPERERYKADFHTALAARVKGLVDESREVVVVGDLNACAAVEDHCEGALMVERGRAEGMQGEDGFWGAGARRWLREWIDAGMTDVVREFWPDRRGMYTCT
ncbi:Endonuclease/exonuclease/phosphatase [Infundibulicybe gibba]|nr:Endonuclease/exonuclease/phosphatase [Infundibulicybe gibba]